MKSFHLIMHGDGELEIEKWFSLLTPKAMRAASYHLW